VIAAEQIIRTVRRGPRFTAGLAGGYVAVLLGLVVAMSGPGADASASASASASAGASAGASASAGAGAGAAAMAMARSGYAGACSTMSSGVTLVVDFTAMNAGVIVTCVSGDPASGWEALTAVYTVVGSQQSGGALVCRINNQPAADPCVRNPPLTAYWSYWHADRGGTWQYSSLGAASYDPRPATVEGWAFGAGTAPAVAPPAAAAPPAPPPAPPPPAGGGASPTTRPPSGGTGTGPDSGQTDGTTPQPGTSGTTGAPMPSAGDTQATTAVPVASVPGPATADPAANSGTPVGTLVGIGLVVLLVAAAASTTVLRRRRLAGPAVSPPSIDLST
jgi:hypothetical protein